MLLFFGGLACPLKNDQHLLDQQLDQHHIDKHHCDIYIYRERVGIVRLRVKGSVAHVVWCDAGGITNRQHPWAHRQGQRERKSKQK